jgi:hypothetical protein
VASTSYYKKRVDLLCRKFGRSEVFVMMLGEHPPYGRHSEYWRKFALVLSRCMVCRQSNAYSRLGIMIWRNWDEVEQASKALAWQEVEISIH